MRIIAKKTLKDFWLREPAARAPLESWHSEAKNAEWMSPADVKAAYGSASILKDGRVVFNIGGNKYRLVAWINYEFFTKSTFGLSGLTRNTMKLMLKRSDSKG